MATETSMDNQFQQRLMAILDGHLENEHFGVKELASEVGLSKSQLLRKIQGLTNKSTSQFIREYRLQKGMALLQEEAGTASEIAYRVGFSSPSYFSTCFHEYYGYPPGEAKFHGQSSQEPGNTLADEGNQFAQSRTKSNKGKLVLYSILGIALLLAASFMIYREVQKDTPGTAANPGKTLIEEKSIAVIPFKNLSGDPEFEYVSDGMTDAIISRLVKIHSIKNVISFTTMLTYKNTDKGTARIANELGVTHLLEGNVQRSGDTIKVILRLIDGLVDTYEWTDDYRADWNDGAIFEMQARVAEKVAINMALPINEMEMEVIQKRPTENNLAYNLYLQAEHQRKKENNLSIINAQQLYEKAISLDPNFAEAYVGLAFIRFYLERGQGVQKQKEAWEKIKGLLERAQRIDSSIQQIEHLMVAGHFYYEWDFEMVEEYYQRQLPILDFGSVPWIGIDYPKKTGRFTEALRVVEAYIQRDPSVGKYYILKVQMLMNLGRIEEAKELLDRTESLYDDNLFCLAGLAEWYYELEEYEKSRIYLNKLMNSFKDRPFGIPWFNAMLLEREGKHKESREQLNEMIKRYDARDADSPAFNIAMYYCAHNDYDNTFAWLKKSYETHERMMTALHLKAVFEPVRGDPRYKELFDKVGFSKVIKL